MTVKIGVNGFGRIGRNFFRAAKQRGADLDFVAVNDITDAATLAHLLKYDSVMGTYDGTVGTSANGITVDGDELRVLAERDPANLPWKELGAEIVIESTGLFTDREKAAKHLEAGAQKVVISAPAKGEDLTVVLGVNDELLRPRDPPRDLERELHHQLRRADGQGAGRRVRRRAGLHDDDPRVHERPADPRPAAQGPAPRARRGDQHHPDLDRRREGGRAGAAASEGQARRHLDARAGARRLGDRPGGVGAQRRHHGAGERGLPRGGRPRAASPASSSTPRTRSSPPTSSARPRRAPSTRCRRW